MAKGTKARGDLARKEDANPLIHNVKAEIAELRAHTAQLAQERREYASMKVDGISVGGYALAVTVRGALAHYKGQLLAEYGIDADRVIAGDQGEYPELIPLGAFLSFLKVLTLREWVARIDQAAEVAGIAGADVEETLRNAFFDTVSIPNWRAYLALILTPGIPEDIRTLGVIRLASALLSTISMGANPRLKAAIASNAGETPYDRLILETVTALPLAGYSYLTEKPRQGNKRQDLAPSMIEFRRLRTLAIRYVEQDRIPDRLDLYGDTGGDDEDPEQGLPQQLGASAEEWAMRHEAQRQLTETIRASGLTPRELHVYELRLQGHSPKETAEALGISVKTVRTLLTRAEERVKKLVAQIGQDWADFL